MEEESSHLYLLFPFLESKHKLLFIYFFLYIHWISNTFIRYKLKSVQTSIVHDNLFVTIVCSAWFQMSNLLLQSCMFPVSKSVTIVSSFLSILSEIFYAHRDRCEFLFPLFLTQMAAFCGQCSILCFLKSFICAIYRYSLSLLKSFHIFSFIEVYLTNNFSFFYNCEEFHCVVIP